MEVPSEGSGSDVEDVDGSHDCPGNIVGACVVAGECSMESERINILYLYIYVRI